MASRRSTARRRTPRWAQATDRELLELRLRELELDPSRGWVSERIAQLHDELAERGLRFKPHVWFSTEWFSPDGVPGIAIPFYLGHERLMRLEQKMMLSVEGGRDRSCMKLLRHEAGHALCTAFRLHYRQSWRDRFGPVSAPYPESYVPKAHSRKHVLHLGGWYAQAHPAEDFAETFAVWLTPNSRWRRDYRAWPALEKLEYVDRLMDSIVGKTAARRSRRHIESFRQSPMTLGEHYEDKQSRYGAEATEMFDRDLLRLFSDDPRYANRASAAAFLRKARPKIREVVVRWTGEYPYTVDYVLRDMIDRCKTLKLRLHRSQSQTHHDASVLVAVRTTRFLHRVPHRIAL